MATQLVELFGFLSDPKPEVRRLAIQHVCSFTAAQAGMLPLFKKHAKKVIPDIMSLCDQDPLIAHDALKALVNLSTDPELRRHMNQADFLQQLVAIITSDTHILADVACMLLSNMTKDDAIAARLIASTTPKVEKLGKSVRMLDQLVQVFTCGCNRCYNPKADYHFLASVFADVTLSAEGRSFFLEKNPMDDTLPIAKLMCFTEHPSVVRRGGVISAIKNCCFDTTSHMLLLSDELGLLPYILLPLCGPEEFDEDDMDGMPDDLQLLPDDKKREPDERLRLTLVETLILLTSTRHGRDILRKRKVYPVIRNLHRAEQNEQVCDAAERVVQMLMRDEAPEPQEETKTVPEDDEDYRIEEV